MNTAARAAALADIASYFPILGPVFVGDLLECVRLELGHPEILDGFRPYGAHFSKAPPPAAILHIISGNTGPRRPAKPPARPAAGFPEFGEASFRRPAGGRKVCRVAARIIAQPRNPQPGPP